MPAQKRTNEEHYELQENKNQDDQQGADGSNTSCDKNKDDEYLVINLADIRKEVQCPICLGIIRKTRTVMECLHRFCKECIDKSMRLGNNECPACRTHCASRRSLRDDPNYDALIAAIYPDIEKYEEEEMALHEEEKTRNMELQDSFSRTLRRQNEAQGRKQTRGKANSTASMRRSQSNLRSARIKRRQSYYTDEYGEPDDNGDEEVIIMSSDDEDSAEFGPKRDYTRTGASGSRDGGRNESDPVVDRQSIGTKQALLKLSEGLTWGSSGSRSRGSNGKGSRKSRSFNLLGRFTNFELQNGEPDIYIKLVPVDAHELPKLQQLSSYCRPTLSVRELREYVAFQNALGTNDIEIYMVQGLHPGFETGGRYSMSGFVDVDLSKHKIQVLQEQETLAEIRSACSTNHGSLILAYRKKLLNSGIDESGMHSTPKSQQQIS